MTLTLPDSRIPDPADAPPLRWGILAPGNIANGFVGQLQTLTRQRVVACGSRSTERAQEFAARHGIERAHTGYEALVADPDVDVVYVASPHSEHHDQALLAIAAGKHVLVEKAFTRNAVEAQEVADAAAAAGVTVMEAMWTRFLPRHDVVRRVLEDGLLGDVETVFAEHGQYFEPDASSRLFNPETAGGALLDLGIYPVSFAHFVLGTPSTISARGTTAFTGVDRQVAAVWEYPSNAVAMVNTTLASRTSALAFVAGSRARLELDGRFYGPGSVRVVSRDGEVVETEPGPPGGLAFEAAHFATLVAEGRLESPLLPLAESVAIMRILDELRAQVGVRYPGEGEGEPEGQAEGEAGDEPARPASGAAFAVGPDGITTREDHPDQKGPEHG